MIIFDLDGTLFNTASAFIPACETFFMKNNRPYPGDTEVMKLVGEPEQYFKSWLLKHSINEDFDIVRKQMIDLEVNHIINSGVLFDGVIHLLKELKEQQFQIALCSNAVSEYQQAVFNKTDIGVYFNFIRLPKSNLDTKSRMVAELINQDLSAPFHTMIGDRIHDVQAAKDNSIISIGCAYGYGGNEIKEADYIVQSASEILKVISRL